MISKFGIDFRQVNILYQFYKVYVRYINKRDFKFVNVNEMKMNERYGPKKNIVTES